MTEVKRMKCRSCDKYKPIDDFKQELIERVGSRPELIIDNMCNFCRLRIAVMRRDRYVCQRCLISVGTKNTTAHTSNNYGTIHHIIPRKMGGGDYLDNLICLCLECHNWIENRTDTYSTKKLIRGSMKDIPEESNTIALPGPRYIKLNKWWSGLSGRDLEIAIYEMAKKQIEAQQCP